MALQDLLLQHLQEVLELLARVVIHEVVLGEPFEAARHVVGQLLQLLALAVGHLLQHLAQGLVVCRRGLLAPAVRRK